MRSMTKLIAACCALSLGFATVGFADEAQDVVNGPGKAPVRSARFGNCVQTKWTVNQDPCAPAPAPRAAEVVQPAAPAPQPVTQLAREQLTIYFLFNKSTLTEGGKLKLDQIADAVNKSPKVTKVNIVGYTDTIGSTEYNDKLSVKRAQAVHAYVDQKMRIPSNIVGLRGLGKRDPVVECKDVKNRKAKIKCLARDRRVEIEFEFEK